ncbi:MAG: putative metal-binding motif-containing protein [Myxococcota bacterium]
MKLTRRLLVPCSLGLTLVACGGGSKLNPVVDSGTNLPKVVCLDNDGDGFNGTGTCDAEPNVDCNDNDPMAFPGARELCNGQDDSCDGQVDENLPIIPYYADGDGDGVGSTQTGEGCKAPPMGSVAQSGDCDDADAMVRPGQAESCNGVDDDCDGTPDNGLPFQDFYTDADGDGFGDPMSAPVNSCQTTVMGKVPNLADCNDANPTVKPGVTELCNKVDDNCDGQVDNGIAFASYYPDSDGDGFGSATAAAESSCAPVPGKVTTNSDCNDANPSVKPGAPELCNAQDDNCDSQVDEGLSFANYYPDVDGDGFGAAGAMAQSACTPIAGKVTNNQDCNDASASVKPGAPEACNGADDDCDSMVDDGLTFTNYYADVDGDGFGAGTAQSACAPVAGRVTSNTDCNDMNPAIKPGAPETCNGVDDDCDSSVDDGLTFTNYYPDGDGDGYGRAGSTAQSSCQPIAGRVTNNTDCDDTRSTVRPGGAEVCNGLDDDCAGGVDNGLTFSNWYADGDGDGYGAGGAVSACSQPTGRVASSTDCNDGNASIRPNAPELCNGVDDNCDTLVDNGVMTLNYYPDVDGDGYGAAGASPQASCSAVAGKVTNNTDCNDSNAAIRPGATEVCNGLDDNCAGGIDNGLTFLNYYPDVDADGFGAAGAMAQSSCAPVAGKVTNNTDCNDTNGAIKPGATEVCNALDDNCAGGIDEGLPTQSYYPDADLDTFGAAAGTPVSSCGPVSGRVANNQDCNDANAAVRPTATESCNNVDDNCNAQVDEGNPGGGGACSTGQSGVCAAGTLTCTSGSVQCVRNVAPSAETCNALDDNCNGQTDEGFTGLGTSCTAGLGVCLRTGVIQCNAAHTGTECSVTAGSPTAAACDGLDNDCDGVVDEPAITSTSDLTTTAFQDLEVQPYYYSSASCAGGVNGTGTDARAGGGLVMSVGSSGISFQPLTSAGAPNGSITTVTSLTYSDVALAQAGDGFVIAGIWEFNNAEIDIYYVDAIGTSRTYRYTQFKLPAGCSGTGCHTLDSLRVVRGNGKRVTLVWREDTVGVRMAQVEPCNISGSWELRAPGCASTTLTPLTVVANAAVVPGIGADSTHQDWVSSQTCPSAATQRRLGITYRPSATQVSFFQVNEDNTSKAADQTVYTVTSPRTLAEPDVSYFKDGAAADQFFVAYVTKDPGSPDADLNYWLTNDPTWHYAYLDYATQNGADSILRPRVSATASRIWMTALRYLDAAEEPTSFKRQVMTRQTDLTGARVPLGSSVEVSPTFGGCGDAACRPGDKSGFTAFASFGRVYYSGSGSSPSGSYASTLTCN